MDAQAKTAVATKPKPTPLGVGWYHEAKYDLWPNETVRRELEKVRKAKAEGIPFHLIDWDNDVE